MTQQTSTSTSGPAADGGPLGGVLLDLGLEAEMAKTVGSAITFLLVLVVVYLVWKLVVRRLFERVMDRRNFDAHARKPLRKILAGGVAFAGVSVAFGAAGYGSFLTSLATIGAAATLAVGFALQDVIKNLTAGVFIFTDRPFRIGDWIEWSDYEGRVEDISLRVTRVRTFDNELLTVPNAALTDGVIKNPVEAGRLRLRFEFGIGYADDVDRATEIIVEEAEAHGDILDDPAPTVRLTDLADSYVGLQSRFWIADPSRADFVRIRGEYVAAVKERFEEEGIDIPYPQRVLHGGLEVGDGAESGEA